VITNLGRLSSVALSSALVVGGTAFPNQPKPMTSPWFTRHRQSDLTVRNSKTAENPRKFGGSICAWGHVVFRGYRKAADIPGAAASPSRLNAASINLSSPRTLAVRSRLLHAGAPVRPRAVRRPNLRSPSPLPSAKTRYRAVREQPRRGRLARPREAARAGRRALAA
jgi:hypothetical protein